MKYLSEDAFEYEERAAIMEYEGVMTREQAEREAHQCVSRNIERRQHKQLTFDIPELRGVLS